MDSVSPHPVTLRQLQYIVAIAELRSFRKAAERCRVAQPSLSAQLAQVESVFGVQLFERDRRGVNLTAAGARVLESARGVLLAADDLAATVKLLADPYQSTVRVGVIPTVAPYLLPEVAAALREALPKTGFHWVEEKTSVLLTELARSELDAAIVAVTPEMRGLARSLLGRDEFVFACAPSHQLSRSNKPLALENLEGASVLLLEDGHCFRQHALSYCTRAGAREVGYRATSLATLIQMVATGEAVTLLPRMALPVENRTQALKLREFVSPVPSRLVALVWRKQSALAAILKDVAVTLREVAQRRNLLASYKS